MTVRPYMLFHKSTRPTGRAVATALGFRHAGIKPGRDRGVYSAVLRWGSSSEFPARSEINSAEGIKRAANKWTTLSCLSEAGVSVVPFSRSFEDVCGTGLVYGRSNYGYGGSGIVIYDTDRQEYPRGARHDFYTAGIKVHREFRFHVVRDEVVRVQGKYLDFPEQDRSGGRVWNHANGYRFKTPQLKPHSRRFNDAIASIAALGLDFGAVDLIVAEDGQHYVLEVNTGPSLSPMTLDCYVRALRPILQEAINAR